MVRRDELKEKMSDRIFKRRLENLTRLHCHDIGKLNKQLNRGLFKKTIIRSAIFKDGIEVKGRDRIIDALAEGQASILTSQGKHDAFLKDQFMEREIEHLPSEDINMDDWERMEKKLKSTSPGISKITGGMIKHCGRYTHFIIRVFNIF